ncbi:MAG: hypothetical protein LW808_002430 [Verrucomicrobiota bacterium]|nr:MAG: hypothetical protein LW808_002430 [Verrucomicrobiota bacterium]
MKYVFTLLAALVPIILTARPAIPRSKRPEPVAKKVVERPKSDFSPRTYGGRLKCFLGGLIRPRYDYALTGDHGQILAYIDTSELVLGMPLLDLVGKQVSVMGDPEPNEYREALVIKARAMTPVDSER